MRPFCATGFLVPRLSAWLPSPKRYRMPLAGAGKVATRSCANQLTRRCTFQYPALSKRPKRQAVMVVGVHLAISSNVLRPGCTAWMKMSQQKMRRWRPRHTVGMPRKTIVTKPGREVQAISMCRALSRGGRENKATDGSAHVAFTPFLIDFQAVYGIGCQF